MHTVKSTHGDVLAGAANLRLVSSVDGLVAAKVSRIRKINTDALQASADGFDAVARGFAKLTEAKEGETPKPIALVLPGTPAADGKPAIEPEPQLYTLSGTPVYVPKDDSQAAAKALTAALAAYLKGEVELSVPELTVDDMRKVTAAGGLPGAAIEPAGSDALAPFAPAL